MRRPRPLSEILRLVLEAPAEERDAYLDELCGEDEATRLHATETIADQQRLSQDLLPELPAVGDAILDRYLVRGVLGVGGMGVVYRTEDRELSNRPTAIKVTGFGDGDRADFDRLRHEAQTACRVTHPNVATTYNFVQRGSTSLIAMEFVAGESLSTLISNRRRLPVPEALSICRQIAEGMTAVHAEGVLHRDLKPDNVMIAKDGTVKIVDFGIGSLVGSKVESPLAGTPIFMSPERLQGGEGGKPADVWSFGCILWECLTGKVIRPPDLGEAWQGPHPPPLRARGLSERGTRLVLKCLAHDPADRLTFTEIADELRQILEPTARRPLSKLRILILWVIALIALALAIFLYLTMRSLSLSPRPSDASSPTPAPEYLERRGRSALDCFGDRGNVRLWTRDFGGLVLPNLGAVWPRTSPPEKSICLFWDQGQAYGAVSVTSATEGNRLHLVDATTSLTRWQRTPTWKQPVGRPRDLPSYVSEDVAAEADSGELALVLCSRVTTYESGIELVSMDNQLLGSYLHPGHLLFLAEYDVDCDGTKELCFYGNNGPIARMAEFTGEEETTVPWGVFLALDPQRVEGQGFPYSPDSDRGWPHELRASEDLYMIVPPDTDASESASIELCNFEDGRVVLHTYDAQVFYVDFCSLEISDSVGRTWSLLDPAAPDRPRLVIRNGTEPN